MIWGLKVFFGYINYFEKCEEFVLVKCKFGNCLICICLSIFLDLKLLYLGIGV